MEWCRPMDPTDQKLGQEDHDLGINLDCRERPCLRTKQSGLLLTLKSGEQFKACGFSQLAPSPLLMSVLGMLDLYALNHKEGSPER